MRQRVTSAAAESAIINELQNCESFLEPNKPYLEFRMTLKKASGLNQVKFQFHGGNVTLRHDGSKYFGKFRPLPWKKRNGEFVFDSQGNHEVSPIWTKELVLVKPEVPAELQQPLALLAMANDESQKAALLSLLPSNVLDYQPKTKYSNLELQWWVASLFSKDGEVTPELLELAKHVEFSFDVKQTFLPIVHEIKSLMDNKPEDKFYSIRVIIDPAIPIYGKSELVEDFSTGELKKAFPLNPVWIGFTEGATLSEFNQADFINPDIVVSGLEKAKLAAQVKCSSYLDVDFLKQQKEKMQDRLAAIGTGKKAHHPILAAIKTAAEQGNQEEINIQLELLKSVEERGKNPHVPIGFTQQFIDSTLKELFV